MLSMAIGIHMGKGSEKLYESKVYFIQVRANNLAFKVLHTLSKYSDEVMAMIWGAKYLRTVSRKAIAMAPRMELPKKSRL